MEEERDQEAFKHICKLCNKRYPSGKSLGGHMRSHFISNSQKKKPALVADDDEYEDGDEYEIEISDQERQKGNGHSGYGLRENPKKTWRMVGNKLQHQQQQNRVQQRICKQCGKGFQSLKALCGHMSSHSEKYRNFKMRVVEDEHSWSSQSNSDDSLFSKKLNRSSISRFRQFSFTLGTDSSCNSEIDHQYEEEELAMCLIMLSRDTSSSYKTCFNLVTAESSDNNSVIVEGGFTSNHGVVNKKVAVVGSGQNVNVPQKMANSDSGYFENGGKKLEFDDSGDGFLGNCCKYEIKKPKVDSGSGSMNSYDDYSKKRSWDVGNVQFDAPESEEKCSKKINQDNFECNSLIISCRKNGNNTPNKISGSLSARNMGAAVAATTATQNAKKGNGSKKLKGHKCLYCPKMFKSGQALGGHKRSHMMGGGGCGGFIDAAPQPEPEPKQAMIDLNLPAPMEEGEEGSSYFVAS